METIIRCNWTFPPTLNRKGASRKPYDLKSVIVVRCDLFDSPTIAMSDIHSHTAAVTEKLRNFVDLSQCTVITAGDMAGAMVYGSDADPTEDLLRINSLAKEFYYVHGNHDSPSPAANKRLRTTRNQAGKLCSLDAGSNKGGIGGVDGTISSKDHINKFPKRIYLDKLERVLRSRPSVLVTHETPAITVAGEGFGFDQETGYLIGNTDVFRVVNSYRPRIHIYGHCHHPDPFYYVNGVQYINVDGRIIIFVRDLEMWHAIKGPSAAGPPPAPDAEN